MELLLGTDDEGRGLPGDTLIVPYIAERRRFVQAKNYLEKREVRAYVLQRVLKSVETPARLVIVGHSLGSVIAADVLRRLPPEVEVVGMVTIGSPLAHQVFHVDRLPEVLAEPPANLGWWVNFWSTADPVPAHRGVSSVIPWVLDQRIAARNPRGGHDAARYMCDDRVATAIGRGLFGSQSMGLAVIERGIDVALDFSETLAVMALRFAHLTLKGLEGDTRTRYAEGLRQVQAGTVEQVLARNADAGRLVPRVIADLAVDLLDQNSEASEPSAPGHLGMTEAVVPLVVIATTNVLRPFEIDVSKAKQRVAMEQLTLEMELGARFGASVFEAVEEARDVLKGPTNWIKWTALGLGAAAVVVATGGLVLAAAPGVAGAAAITSALAAFGPGGMIGGLLTAGTLVTAGGGSIAAGLAAPATAAVTVEAVVATQLATAIVRKRHGLVQDPQTWSSFAELEVQVARELARLKAVSDDSAPSVKELQRKLDAIHRALSYLQHNNLGPAPLELTPGVDAGDVELDGYES
jgi:pimeloyl-ACP methyl ester carboxylesterase